MGSKEEAAVEAATRAANEFADLCKALRELVEKVAPLADMALSDERERRDAGR